MTGTPNIERAIAHLLHAHAALKVPKPRHKTAMKHAFLAIHALQGRGVPMPGAMQEVAGPPQRPTSGGVY